MRCFFILTLNTRRGASSSVGELAPESSSERCVGQDDLALELIEFVRAVPQPVVVRDVVEKLLEVERPSEQESEVSVVGVEERAQEVDRLASVECVLVRQPVLDPLRQRQTRPERLGHAREHRWVDPNGLASRTSDGASSRLDRSSG